MPPSKAGPPIAPSRRTRALAKAGPQTFSKYPRSPGPGRGCWGPRTASSARTTPGSDPLRPASTPSPRTSGTSGAQTDRRVVRDTAEAARKACIWQRGALLGAARLGQNGGSGGDFGVGVGAMVGGAQVQSLTPTPLKHFGPLKRGGGVWHDAMVCCSRLQLAAPTGRSPFAALSLDPFPP